MRVLIVVVKLGEGDKIEPEIFFEIPGSIIRICTSISFQLFTFFKRRA